MTYRLTEEAEDDLAEIYADGELTFGEAAASAYIEGLYQIFALLSKFPQIARERRELPTSVRIHPYGAHLIVYRTQADESVIIVRVRHAHEDWQ